MKYHTIGGGSSTNVAGDTTKMSGFTLYADLDLLENNKISYTESDMKKIREQLENVQKDLKLQTKRCRYLVSEYTRKLQEKEQLYQNEKVLRDTQLAKVLKALLIFEARLRQEQKLISHQLSEKDYIITTQRNDIKKLLMASQYCKNCRQYYSPTSAESLDSSCSAEYVATELDYQSSNFESLDSSSETYATSERDYSRSEKILNNNNTISQKNTGRRKVVHRKSIGTYFEVLKLRNESPLSNDDDTSADYDNLDSLPPEIISDKISVVSESIDAMLNKHGTSASESSTNISSSECDKTVIIINTPSATKCEEPSENKQLTETIPPVFESNGDNSNDNWYASASDQEDEEQRDIYRNNPVLECMNQILLQNINSPPKTPSIERKNNKNNKRVKFSDEEDKSIAPDDDDDNNHDYYETPIQKTPNFYETPQSIYSNDYEQILSKSSDESSASRSEIIVAIKSVPKDISHYIEMETSPHQVQPSRRNKILRVPPALPPKPPNLVSKCKMHKISTLPAKKASPSENSSTDLEPDYCSISELNLPQNKVKKISVVAEVHSPTSNEIQSRLNVATPTIIIEKHHQKPDEEENNVPPNLIVRKCVEKLNNIQMAKHHHSSVNVNNVQTPTTNKNKKNDVQIPKLPQVSEIIIPDDPEENEEDEIISQDNYVKNNTQILLQVGKTCTREPSRIKPIVIGSSVSSLISGFNNHHHQIINDINKKKPEFKRINSTKFSSFENLQNLDKHFTKPADKSPASFENFDLSQNFEEFKLDDCDIEEYDVEGELEWEDNNAKTKLKADADTKKNLTYIPACVPPNLNQTSIEILKKQLALQRNHQSKGNLQLKVSSPNQPTYEHFLECTGLSSKAILTPARILSNHKSMLKPKDVKMRSKVRASANIFENNTIKHSGSTMKYWSEPFV